MVDFGTVSGSIGPVAFAFADGFDFHSVSFEVDVDSPYKFTVADLNAGPRTIGPITVDVMDKLGLEIRVDIGGGFLGPSLGDGGFDQPNSSFDMFTIALESGTRYVGSFVGFTSGAASIGPASLASGAADIGQASLIDFLSSDPSAFIATRLRDCWARGGKKPVYPGVGRWLIPRTTIG